VLRVETSECLVWNGIDYAKIAVLSAAGGGALWPRAVAWSNNERGGVRSGREQVSTAAEENSH
jgi:hypothetical protein